MWNRITKTIKSVLIGLLLAWIDSKLSVLLRSSSSVSSNIQYEFCWILIVQLVRHKPCFDLYLIFILFAKHFGEESLLRLSSLSSVVAWTDSNLFKVLRFSLIPSPSVVAWPISNQEHRDDDHWRFLIKDRFVSSSLWLVVACLTRLEIVRTFAFFIIFQWYLAWTD